MVNFSLLATLLPGVEFILVQDQNQMSLSIQRLPRSKNDTVGADTDIRNIRTGECQIFRKYVFIFVIAFQTSVRNRVT